MFFKLCEQVGAVNIHSFSHFCQQPAPAISINFLSIPLQRFPGAFIVGQPHFAGPCRPPPNRFHRPPPHPSRPTRVKLSISVPNLRCLLRPGALPPPAKTFSHNHLIG